MSKPVKREEAIEEDEDEKILGSMLRKKKSTVSVPATSPAAAKSDSNQRSKFKKDETAVSDSRDKKPNPTSHSNAFASSRAKKGVTDSDDEKPIAMKSANPKDDKVEKRKRKTKEAVKKHKVENAKKKERKVYDFPGQKRDPPEERDPLRIFYETLHEQVPRSEMAAIWMMESGLLPLDEAKKIFAMKQKKSHFQKLTSPVNTVTSVKKTPESVTIKTKTQCSSQKSSNKKKSETTVEAKKTKKRKKNDSSEEDSDDDFVISRKVVKKQKA